MTKVEDAEIMLKNHRFGNYGDDQPSLFAMKMPFSNAENKSNIFDVVFDVIDGDLPFLLGLPSLISMGATFKHKHFTMAFSLCGRYQRFKLSHTEGCLLYTSPSPRDLSTSRMPSSA